MSWWWLALAVALADAPEDGAAWMAWEGDEPTTARRLAEEALLADPGDLGARFVLGAVLLEHEGDLPRAAAQLEEVDRRYRRIGDPAQRGAWLPHAMALAYRARVAAAMDDRVEELSWLDQHDAAYNPKAVAPRAWALMKLDRVEEARAVIAEAMAADEPWDQVVARTSLCAVEGELGRREAHDLACQAALEAAEAEGLDVGVESNNATFSAMAMLRYGDAERIARKGLSASADDVSNPWANLARLRLLEGRGLEAVEAVEQMQRWRLHQRPALRDQTRAELDAVLARVLWAAGHADRALELIDRALRLPDRNGYSSTSADRERLHLLVQRLAVAADARQRAREAAAGESWWRRLFVRASTWAGSWATLWDAAAVRDLAASSYDTAALLRPYRSDGIGAVEPWFAGELIDVVGVGVFTAALEAAAEPAPPELSPFYDAYGAEAAWRSGDDGGALARVDLALAALPSEEVMLRARVGAVGADIAWRTGAADALDRWEAVVRSDPGAVRRLGLALPVSLVDGGDSELADALARSPTLDVAGGMTLIVSPGSVCLSGARGVRVGCAATSGTLTERVEAVHLQLLSLPSKLDRHAIDRLDGVAAFSAERAAQAADAVLDRLTRPSPEPAPRAP